MLTFRNRIFITFTFGISINSIIWSGLYKYPTAEIKITSPATVTSPYTEIESESETEKEPVSATSDNETATVKDVTGTTTTITLDSYNAEEYQLQLHDSLLPLSNKNVNITTTTAFAQMFRGGFCNQYIMFIGVMLLAHDQRSNQIIEQSIRWKDTHATEISIEHNKLFDVVHWNSNFPNLPRLAMYDEKIHTEMIIKPLTNITIEGKVHNASYLNTWNVEDPVLNAKLPRAIGPSYHTVNYHYQRFSKILQWRNGATAQRSEPENYAMYKLIHQAFRPHPELQVMVDKVVNDLRSSTTEGGTGTYAVLHARIEPDMDVHPMCEDKKVRNVTDIIDAMYAHYPEPPVSRVLIMFNRNILEAEAQKDGDKDNSVHQMAVHNLKVINEAVQSGLWGGKVEMVEAGSRMVEEVSDNPFYKHFSNIVGGIVNFFVAIQADLFIGTEVSSYTTMVINSRFYRELRQNYFYRPEGLYCAIPEDRNVPHKFVC